MKKTAFLIIGVFIIIFGFIIFIFGLYMLFTGNKNEIGANIFMIFLFGIMPIAGGVACLIKSFKIQGKINFFKFKINNTLKSTKQNKAIGTKEIIENNIDAFSQLKQKLEIKHMALQEWKKVFDKALEDKIITDEEKQELEDLQEKLGLSIDDTKHYWQKYKLEYKKEIAPINKQLITDDDFESSFKSYPEWIIKISFGKSSSSNFNRVVSSIKIHPSFKIIKSKKEGEIIEISFKPDEILLFNELWNRVKTWKSTVVKINDDIIDKKSLSRMLICFRDKVKNKDINPAFCYGASPFTFNIFGCHRTKLRDGLGASDKCWYHIGNFDNNNVFHVDKKAIVSIIIKNLYEFKICPALNIERIKHGLFLIPDEINPKKDYNWRIENYNGENRLVPTPKYNIVNRNTFFEQSGKYGVSIEMTQAMIDYYSSVSPQFKQVLDELKRKDK